MEEVLGMPQGTRQGCQGRVQTETTRQDPRQMALLGSMGGVLQDFQAGAGLANSNQKSRVLVSLPGVLSKKTVDHKGFWGFIPGTYICS